MIKKEAVTFDFKNWIWYTPDLKSSEKLTLLRLSFSMEKDVEVANLTINEIVESTSLSRSCIKVTIKSLISKGYITLTEKFTPRSPNNYKININHLEKIVRKY